jgi:hypothetical protein
VRWQGGKGLTPLWTNDPRYAIKPNHDRIFWLVKIQSAGASLLTELMARVVSKKYASYSAYNVLALSDRALSFSEGFGVRWQGGKWG